MTDELMDEGTWDLAEVLQERIQPTDTVTIYLDEVASFTKAGLLNAKPKKPEAIVAWDAAIAEVEEILEQSKYVIHLTAVPSRMREDIASKAMHEKPMTPNLLGQDDVNNTLERQKIENDLVWHTQITNVVNPKGLSKRNWTLEEMKQFSASLPTNVQRAVDAAIKDLTTRAEQFTVKSKNADF